MVCFEIKEPSHFGLKLQLNRSCGPVSLFTYNYFGLSMRLCYFLVPISEFSSPLVGFLILKVVLLAVDEQDDIGILFDGT